jgi:hypothetical protein
MRNLSIALVLGLASLGVNAVSDAADVLVNGNFETGVGIPNWTLTTSITGIPGSTYPSVFEHSSSAAYPDFATGLGLFVKPATAVNGPDYNHNNLVDAPDYVLWRKDPTANGGDPDGYNTWRANFGTNTNRQINLTLDHDPVTVGASTTARTFTFSGYSFWGNGDGSDPTTGYSGGVTTLNAQSPSGSVPSPTQSVLQIDFLNAFSTVLATKTLNLRTGLDQDNNVVQSPLSNDALWHQSTFTVNDPFLGTSNTTSTSKIKVRVALTNMVANFGYQDVLLDNFSLFKNSETLDRLNPTPTNNQNGNLDTSGTPVGWTIATAAHPATFSNGSPRPSPTSIQFANPSINPASNHTSGGSWGVWLRPFVNTTDYVATDPANNVDGTLTQTVAGLAGASYAFSAWTVWEQNYCGGLANSGTTTFLKMEFLDGSNNAIGSPVLLDLYQAGMRNSPTAPFQTGDWQHWATPTTVAPAGTAHVRVSMGGLAMFNSGTNPQSAFFDDLALLQTSGSGTVNLLTGGVPEPTTCWLMVVASIWALGIRRHSR